MRALTIVAVVLFLAIGLLLSSMKTDTSPAQSQPSSTSSATPNAMDAVVNKK